MTDRDTVNRILDELIRPHLPRFEVSKARQRAFFRHEKPDRPPIIITGSAPENIDHFFPEIPEADLDREFFRLLLQWLHNAAVRLSVDNDAIPFIYAQFGTAVNLACVGMEPLRSQGTYGLYGPPHPLGRNKSLQLTPDDIQIRGTFKKALDFMTYAQEMVGDVLPVLKPDLQAPFSLACMIMGEDFYVAMIEEPEAVHQFIDFCGHLFCASTDWCKECVSEPRGEQIVGGGGRITDRFGTNLSIDHAVMCSPEFIDTFVMPSTQKAAHRYNGALVHYCGWHEPLAKAIAEAPELKVLNQGLVPGKHDDLDFDRAMELCRENNTLYFGQIPPAPGEPATAYLDRLHEWASRGILLPTVNFGRLQQCEGCTFTSAAQVAEYWYGK